MFIFYGFQIKMAAFPFSGLKKQLNKANQYMTERITGVEGTKMDAVVQDMEQHTDVFGEMVEDLQVKTKEYLQPNPTVRAKMAAVKGISKLSGQAKASSYPQPEGTLGEAMGNFGQRLEGYESTSDFALALSDVGDSLKQMADLKYSLDDTVKQNFLEPLHHTQSKDLKEVLHHRRKMQGHKLDFDCKKRTGAADSEIKLAEDKFSESLHLAQLGMHNLLAGTGTEHMLQLKQFVEALLEYHVQCVDILQPLHDKLIEKTNEAASKPRLEFRPKTLEDLGISRTTTSGHSLQTNATTPVYQNGSGHPSPVGWKPHPAPPPSPRPSPATTPVQAPRPSCKALYNFDAENPAELSFKEGDTIFLKSQIDANWLEGILNGRTGYFPVAYVSIINPLSK